MQQCYVVLLGFSDAPLQTLPTYCVFRGPVQWDERRSFGCLE